MDPTAVSQSAPAKDVIPGYRIEKLISSGGMGSVYLAIDENLRRQVAIKIMHPEFKNDPEYRDRFIREARTVAGFQHPNIVTIYASDCGQNLYMVMEYVSGGTLSQRTQSQPLSIPDAMRIAVRMADALAYAHANDVIHRDFKPGNILMKRDGTPVLADFGIAKSEITTGTKTETGMVVGSMRYMAPEQALGQPISNRVDVYSFGLVLYETVAQQLPEQHPVRDKQDFKGLAQALGPDLGELVGRCLAAQPSARPSAAECRDRLEFLLNKPAQWPSTPQRIWIGAILTIVIALAVGGIAWLGASRRNDQGSSPPAAPQTPAAGPATSAKPETSSTRVLWSPPSAQLFIDGNESTNSPAKLSPGAHELLAVAPGYYGEIQTVRVTDDGMPKNVNISLRSTSLPTAAEVERFSELADAQRVTDAEVQSMKDRTLSTVIRAKLLQQSGRSEDYDHLVHDIENLQDHGDSRSAVAVVLVDSLKAGHIGRAQVREPLIAASNGGDPMATFFLAVTYRESLSASGGSATSADPRFQKYCNTLRLAATQGWDDVAAESLRRDHCPASAD